LLSDLQLSLEARCIVRQWAEQRSAEYFNEGKTMTAMIESQLLSAMSIGLSFC